MTQWNLEILSFGGKLSHWSLLKKLEIIGNYRLIRDSEFFDPEWYSDRVQLASKKTAIAHYLLHGATNGSSPSPHFDGNWYLATYKDVAQARSNPLVHYLRAGCKEGRRIMSVADAALYNADYQEIANSTLFNAAWYAANNMDLANTDPVEHYLLHGGNEGRAPSPGFDSRWYLSRYPDVSESGKNPLIFHLRLGRGRDAIMPERLRTLLRSNDNEWSLIEPEIPASATTDAQCPISTSISSAPVYTAWKRLFSSLSNAYTTIVFIGELPADIAATAEVMAGIISNHGGPESTLIVATDVPETYCLGALYPEAKVVRLCEANDKLADDDKMRLVEALIFSVSPNAVINLGSNVCWLTYAAKGKALSRFAGLYAALFRNESHAAVLREALPSLTRLYVDDKYYLDILFSTYLIPASMFRKILYIPRLISSPESNVSQVIVGWRPRVLWSGNLGDLEGIRILARIMSSLPSIDFECRINVFEEGAPLFDSLPDDIDNAVFRFSAEGTKSDCNTTFDAILLTGESGIASTLAIHAIAKTPIVLPDCMDKTVFPPEADIVCVEGALDSNGFVAALTEIFSSQRQAPSHSQTLRLSGRHGLCLALQTEPALKEVQQ